MFVPNLGGEAAKNQEVGIANALERTSQSLGLFSTTMRVTRVEDAIGIDGGRLCTDSFANLSLGTRRAVSHRFLESVERVFFFFLFLFVGAAVGFRLTGRVRCDKRLFGRFRIRRFVRF